MKGAVENLKQFFFQTNSTKITLIYINRLNTIIIIYIYIYIYIYISYIDISYIDISYIDISYIDIYIIYHVIYHIYILCTNINCIYVCLYMDTLDLQCCHSWLLRFSCFQGTPVGTISPFTTQKYSREFFEFFLAPFLNNIFRK